MYGDTHFLCKFPASQGKAIVAVDAETAASHSGHGWTPCQGGEGQALSSLHATTATATTW
jgi:hypothetical protein